MPDAPSSSGAPTAPGAPLNFAQIYALEQWNREQIQRITEVTSPPAERLTRLMTDFIGRGTAAELRNSGNPMDQLLGRAMPLAGAAAASYLGLSPATMVAGMSSIFENGGTNLMTRGGSMQLAGLTAAGNQLTGQMFNMAARDFFLPGGALNYANTYGASRDDIGNALNELQRRGVFAGDVAGFSTPMNQGLRAQMTRDALRVGDVEGAREIEKIADGDSVIQANPALAGKVSAWTKETLKNVQELRGVLGNLDVGTILNELERLTGTDIGKPGNMGNAMMEFRRRVAQGQTAGLNAADSLAFSAATASTMDAHLSARLGLPQGAMGDVASAMAGAVDRYALSAYQTNRGAGGYRALPEVAAAMSSDVSKVLTDSPEIAEAMFAASRMKPGSEAYNSMMASIEAFGSAGTAEQRQNALMDMSRMTKQMFGTRAGALAETIGIDNLMRHVQQVAPSVLGAGMDAALRSNQGAMLGDFENFVRTFDSDAPYSRALGGTGRAAEFAHSMFQNFSGSEMQQMLNAGSLEAMQSIAGSRALPGFGSASDALAAAQARISAASGGAVGVAEFLGNINSMVQATPGMASMVGGGALSAFDRSVSDFQTVNIASKGMTPLTFSQQLEQSMLGGDIPLEDQAFLRYGMENKHASMHSLKFNEAGGLAATEDEAGQLAKAMAGKYNLYDMMGVESGNNAALAKALASGESGSLVLRAMQDADVLGSVGDTPDGERALIFSDDKEAVKKSYQDELDKIKAGGKPPAASTGQAAVPVVFNLTEPGGGVRTWTGTSNKALV